jgi:hypothetical protein
MIYFLALIPATALTIAGYFVLFLSARSEGALRTFGKYLGFWAFTLAGLVILGAIFAAAHGPRGHGFGMHGRYCPGGMHHPMFRPWSDDGRGPPPMGPPGAPPPPPGATGSNSSAPPPPAPADSSRPAQH